MFTINKTHAIALALGIVVALLCCSSSSSWAAPAGVETAEADQLEQEVFGEQPAEDQKDKNRPVPIEPAKPGSIAVDDVRLMDLRARCRLAAEERVDKEAERFTKHKGRLVTAGGKKSRVNKVEVTEAPIVLSPAEEAERNRMREACARAAQDRADKDAKRGLH